VIRDSFDNSLPTFIRAFLDGKKITEKDAIEIKKIIEEATK
jgi:predicted transcriptional regulator